MNTPNKPKAASKKSAKSYMKYSGLAFQLLAMIGVSIYVGQKIDIRMGNDASYITILLILFVFIAFMVKLYKELFTE